MASQGYNLSEEQKNRLAQLRVIKNNLVREQEKIEARRGTVQEVLDDIDNIWDNYQEIVDDATSSTDDSFWETTNAQYFEATGYTKDREHVWIKKSWYYDRIDYGYPPNDSPTSNEKLKEHVDLAVGYASTHPYPDQSQKWFRSFTMSDSSKWKNQGNFSQPDWILNKLVEYTNQLKKLVNKKKGEIDRDYIFNNS